MKSALRKIVRINDHPLMLLVTCSVLFFLFLVFRNTGLYIFWSDEFVYNRLARLIPLSESSIPSYLFLKLYSFTNYCGDGFLECARLINSVLFVSAIPFIFFISRRVASNGVSVIISLLAVFGPINSVTAYFMPESFYFLSFWVFCWYLLSLELESGKYRWFLVGAIYAICSLVKPHAILFLPAILVYIGSVFFLRKSLISRPSATAFFSFILGTFLIKFAISYIFAGPSGLNIFGAFYGSMASSATADSERYIQILLTALENIKGHILVLVLLYGLPLVLAMSVTAKALLTRGNQKIQEVSQASQYEKVSVLSLVIIFNLICVTSLFTASIVGFGPYENPYRLHMRYYNFALPLFYIIGAGALSRAVDIKKSTRYILGTIAAIFSGYALWSNIDPFQKSLNDNPELLGLTLNYFAFKIIGALLVLALFSWVIFNRRGIQLYLYLALPLFVGISSYHVGLELNNRHNLSIYDKAGIFTRHNLSSDDISKVVIVGSDPGELDRSLHYLDNVKAYVDVIPRDAAYDLARLPPDKEWILLIGDHELIGNHSYKIHMMGFSLVRVSPDILVKP
jgi:phosphoglycerol transferase